MNSKSDISNVSVENNCITDSRYVCNSNCVDATDNNIKKYKKKLLKNQMMMLHYKINQLPHKFMNVINRKNNREHTKIDKNSVLKKTKYELSSYIASSNTYVSNYNFYDEYILPFVDKNRNISNNINYDKSKKCIDKSIHKCRYDYCSNPCSHKMEYLYNCDNKNNYVKEQIEKWKRKKIPSYLKKNSHYFKNVLSNIYNDKNNLTQEYSNDLLKNTQKLFLSNKYIFENNIVSSPLGKKKKKKNKIIQKKNNFHLNNMNSLNYENKNLRVKENLTLKNNKQNNRYSSPDILSDEKDYHDNSNTNCFICSYPIHKKEEKYFLKKDSTSGVLQLDIIKKKLKEKGELKYIDKKDRKEDNSNKDCTNKDSINKDNRNKNYRNKDKIKNYEDGYYDEEKIKEQNEPEKWECITKNGNEECFLNKKHIRNKKENTDENIENKNRYFDMEKEKISNDIRLHHNKKREIEENKNSLTYTHSSNTFANNLNLSNDLSKINKSEQTYNEFCYSKAYEKENSHINTRKRDDSCDKEDTFVGLMKYYNTEQKKNENNNKDEETKLINDQISEEKKKTKIINYIKNMFLLENKNSLINLESHAHKDMEEHSSKNSNSICTNSIKDNRIKELHTSENEQKINEENYKGEISYNKTWNSNKKNIENFESTKIPHKDNSENVEYNFLKKKTENEMNLNINNPHNNISLLKDNKEKENLLEKKSDCFNENKKDLNEKKNKTNIKINSNILKKILKMKIESMKNNVNNRKMYKEQKMELTSFNDKELSKFPREVLFNDEGTELKDCEKNTIKEKNTVISSNNNIKHGFQVVETGGNQGHEENNFDNSFTPFHVINSSNRISSVDNFFDNNNNVNIYENKFKSSNELLLINDKMHGLNIINRKFNEDVVDAKYNNKNSDTIKNNSNNNNNINDNIKNDSNYNSDNNDFMINFDKKYNSKDCVGNNSDGNMSNSEDINDTIYNSNNKIEVLDFNKSYYCYLKKIKNNEVYPNSEEPITKDDKIKLMKAYLNNKKKKKNSEKYLLKYNIEFFKMAQFFCEDYNMYNNYLRNMAYNLSKYGDDVDKTAFSIVKLLGSKKNLNEKNSLKGRNENNDLSTSTEIKKDNNFLKYKKNPNITCDPFNCDSIEIVNTFNKKKKFIKNSILLARTKMNENLYSKKKGSATLSSITTDKNNLIKSKLDQSNNKINYFTQNQNKYSNKYLMNKKSSIFLNQKHIKDYFKEKNNTFSRSSSTKFANEIEPFNGSKNCYITKRSNSTKQRNSLLKTSALIEKYEKLKCK